MRFLTALVLLSLSFVTTHSIAQTRVAELRCDHQINPIGIESETPSFSWKSVSPTAKRQAAYQLELATSPDFDQSKLVFNSQKVISAESANVPYSGPALERGHRYFWRVRIWDENNGQSDFSETAYFEISPPRNSWKADWISAPAVFSMQRLNGHRYAMIRGESHDFLEPLPLIRKTFDVKKKVASARLYISAPGFFEAFLNSKPVSPDILNPSFTNFDKTVLYSTYDVTELISEGENAIGVMLGNGWYNSTSKEVWGFDKAPWRNLPALLASLRITYDDGTQESIVTDHSWRAAPGPITFSAVRQGEYYDSRLESTGWSAPGFDDQSWHPVRRVAGPIGELRSQTIPPTRVTEILKPVAIKKLSNGNTVYDFGQNIAGFSAIQVTGKSGSRIQIKYAEKASAEGAADQSGINNLLADSLFQVDRYTLKGTGSEQWSPKFVYHGFRFAEVSIEGEAQIVDIRAHAINTSFESAGTFSSTEELLNKIQESTRWSFRGNFVGFPTDCPQREKNGWTGDAQLACETGLSNFDAYTSYDKWLQDLRDEQQPDGSLPGIVPTSGWGYYWGNGPAWDIACVVIPWTMYQYTGDASVLNENYDMMKKYVDYMHRRSPELITDFGLGDWIPVKTQTPVAVTSTGYFYYGALTLSRIAGLLNKTDDQQKYSQLSQSIRSAFNKKFFDAKTGQYANGSQTALSCALFHGMVEPKNTARVVDNLVKVVHEKDDHIDTGILGARYLLHVLSENGHNDLALRIVTQKTFPGWGDWIEKGATTLWEDWWGETSQNHIMFGDVSSWFIKRLAGIQPDEANPGFRHFFIRADVNAVIPSAQATYESPYGTIVSKWTRDGNKVTHQIEIPFNTTASCRVQIADKGTVLVNGKPLSAQKVASRPVSKRSFDLELEAGVYEVQYPVAMK